MKLQLTIVLLLISPVISQNTTILDLIDYPKIFDDILKCADDIIEEYGKFRSILVYSYEGVIIDELAKIILKNGRVTNLSQNLDSMKSPQEFVTIVIDRLADLLYYFETMFYTEGFKPQGYYMVIYLGNENLDWVSDIIWHYYITKIIVLDINNNVYTYKRYVDDCEIIKKIFLFNCRNIDMEVIKMYDAPIKMFKGCELRVLALTTPPFVINCQDESNPGIEVKMLTSAAKYLNVTLNFIDHNYTDYGYSNDNNFTHMLGDLFGDKADMVIGGFPQFDLRRMFHNTVPYMSTELKIFVPVAQVIPGWKNCFKIYDPLFWPLHVSTIVLFFVIKNRVKTIDGLAIFAFVTNNSYPIIRPKGWLAHYYIAIFLFYIFIVSNYMTTGLTPFFMIPTHLKQIKTTNELFESNLHFGGIPYAHIQAIHTDPHMINNWTHCYADGRCIDRLLKTRDISMIENVEAMRHRRLFNNNHRELVYPLTDWKFSYFISMVTRKGHPVTSLLSNIIFEFSQAGLIEKWYRETVLLEPNEITTSFQPLSFDITLVVFMILGVGYGMASISFCYELRSRNKITTS